MKNVKNEVKANEVSEVATFTLGEYTLLESKYRDVDTTKTEYKELKQSIELFGVQSPIVIAPIVNEEYYGVIGGFHRLEVCKELKIVPPFEVVEPITLEALFILQVENNRIIKAPKGKQNKVIKDLATLGKSYEEITQITGLGIDQIKFYVSIDEDALKLVKNLNLDIDEVSQTTLKKASLENVQKLSEDDKTIITTLAKKGDTKGANKALNSALTTIVNEKKKVLKEKATDQKKGKKISYAFSLSAKKVKSIVDLAKENGDYEGALKAIEKGLSKVVE